MATTIAFYAQDGASIYNLAGSGLGFYGEGGFGQSVSVGGWSKRSFVTSSGGTLQGPEACNVTVLLDGGGTVVPTGCILGQSGSGINLLSVPNYLSTLNIRLTADSAVKTQNAKLRLYNRTSVDANPSGVTTAVCECVHPDTVQNPNGSGGSSWTFVYTTGANTLNLTSSPGTSGLRPSGANTISARHDWFVNLAASPNITGTHTLYGLWFSCETL